MEHQKNENLLLHQINHLSLGQKIVECMTKVIRLNFKI